jgi:hypothetical protein
VAAIELDGFGLSIIIQLHCPSISESNVSAPLFKCYQPQVLLPFMSLCGQVRVTKIEPIFQQYIEEKFKDSLVGMECAQSDTLSREMEKCILRCIDSNISPAGTVQKKHSSGPNND